MQIIQHRSTLSDLETRRLQVLPWSLTGRSCKQCLPTREVYISRVKTRALALGVDRDTPASSYRKGEEERCCPSLPEVFANVSCEALCWHTSLPLLHVEQGCLHCPPASLPSDLVCRVTPPLPSLHVLPPRFLSQTFFACLLLQHFPRCEPQ